MGIASEAPPSASCMRAWSAARCLLVSAWSQGGKGGGHQWDLQSPGKHSARMRARSPLRLSLFHAHTRTAHVLCLCLRPRLSELTVYPTLFSLSSLRSLTPSLIRASHSLYLAVRLRELFLQLAQRDAAPLPHELPRLLHEAHLRLRRRHPRCPRCLLPMLAVLPRSPSPPLCGGWGGSWARLRGIQKIPHRLLVNVEGGSAWARSIEGRNRGKRGGRGNRQL